MDKKMCPCCSGNSIKDFITYYNLPEILFPVDYEDRDKIDKYDLKLHYCNDCNHIFQMDANYWITKRIYSELYKYYPFENDESFDDTYRKPFNNMFDIFFPNKVNHMNLIDIGCGSAELMKRFSEKGFKCTGIDPSRNETINLTKLHLIKGSYEMFNFKLIFDVIIARFVLEHIIDLNIFMNKISKDLKDDGIIFVQVPSTLNFIKSGILCIGAHEHIHYFSKKSLSALFKRYGYVPQVITEWRTSSLLGCFLKRKTSLSYESELTNRDIYLSFSEMIDYSIKDLIKIIKNNKNICFYGSGLQLIWILYLSGFNFSKKNIYIVDDNDILHGRYIPNTNYAILPVDKKILKNCDIIVLTLNPVYYNKIIRKIKDLKIKGKNIIIFKFGKWKEISFY